jgi:hypothetical protein
MVVEMTGPRGGKLNIDLQSMTLVAMNSFARQLGISRLKTNIHIKFHHKLFVENTSEGLCESVDDRNFIIDVGLYGNWLSTLAHEMVHVKQFARGELSSSLQHWKGRDHSDTDYWDQPWEKEARRLQNKMVLEFEKDLNS